MPLQREALPISRWRTLLLAAAIIWLAMLCWWHRRVAIDDAWITFRYTANLLAGHGMAFNPGERLEGYSNFSWVLLMVPAMVADIDPLDWARVLAFLSASTMVGLCVMGWTRHSPDRDAIGRSTAAGFLIAANVPLAVWVMGGLESALQSLLLFVYTLGLARFLTRSSVGSGRLALAAAVGMLLTRPEGFAFGALLGLGFAKPNLRLITFRHLSIFLYVVLVYTFWRYTHFGTIVANTVTAKVDGDLGGRLIPGLLYTLGAWAGPQVLIPLIAIWGGIRTSRHYLAPTRWTPNVTLVLVGGLVAGMQLCFAIAVGGDWMPAGRFVVPAVAPLCLVLAVTIKQWPFLIRFVLIGYLMIGGVLHARKDGDLQWYRWAARESGGSLVRPLAEAGDWLRENSDRGDLVAGSEAGVLPYRSGLRFIDMVGLVDAHVARRPGELHHKTDPDYVLGRAPRWIVLTVRSVGGSEEGAWPTDQAMKSHPEFARRYSEVRRFGRFLMGPGGSLDPAAIVIFERLGAPLP